MSIIGTGGGNPAGRESGKDSLPWELYFLGLSFVFKSPTIYGSPLVLLGIPPPQAVGLEVTLPSRWHCWNPATNSMATIHVRRSKFLQLFEKSLR